MPSSIKTVGLEDRTARNLAYKSLKYVPIDQIELHPQAVVPFEWFLTVHQSSPMPAAWMEPLLGVREQNKLRIFAGFETWRTAPASDCLPVTVIPRTPIGQTLIEETAWCEVLKLAYGQLAGFNGHARVARAIRAVPAPFREPFIGSVTDNALAKLLGVDPCRLKKKASK